MSELTAVVLAGGERDDVCRDDATAVNKAFISVGGSVLVTRVLRALRETKHIARIRVVAPAAAPASPLMLTDERLDSGAKITDSLRAGFANLAPDDLVLVAAADLPFLSSVGTDDFITQALGSQADLCYGYLERLTHEARYPTLPHTWARMREGIYCGAGLSAIRPRALPALLHVLDKAAAARKAPLRLAALLGFPTLVQYALGLLRVRDAELRASILLRSNVRGVLTPHADLAVNIDRYDDLVRVERVLSPQRPPASFTTRSS